MVQQENNMVQIRELESALNERLAVLTKSGASPGEDDRQDALIDICEARNLSLTICSENIAYIHKDEGEFCLRVEFKRGDEEPDRLLLKPCPLNEEMHTALSMIKETHRKPRQLV